VLEGERAIDILKIDTEGLELDTVRAIPDQLLARIDEIYYETPAAVPLYTDRFEYEYRTGIARLRRRRGA
jgi:hypothetical protein